MDVAPHGTSGEDEDGIDHVDEYETESKEDSDNDLVLAEAESELDVLSPDLAFLIGERRTREKGSKSGV